MAIEWLVISAAVKPYVKDYLAERAKKLASERADGILASIYRRVVPDEKLLKANESFVSRFDKELDRAVDLGTVTTQAYTSALKLFLRNPSVQDALLAPLDTESDLDWKLLRGIWSEIRSEKGEPLIALPEDFSWAQVAKTYRQSIHNQKLGDPELRQVLAVLAAERTAGAVERIAGPARVFDLKRYAEALKTAYAYLKLGSLDSDWTRYERRVRLESVYVPQSVKRALPPLDLTRDYLESKKKNKTAPDDEQRKRLKEEYAHLTARPLMEVVDDPKSKRLVLLGDPGLGKSSLLKLLALRWADTPSRPVTVLIELRRASGHTRLLEYVEKGANPVCCLPEIELHQYLGQHDSLVLFDGLDEVMEPARTDMVLRITRFADDYPKARIIVTTRIHGYFEGSTHPDQFRDAGFDQYTLQDFSAAEIEQFIQLWHREAFADMAERTKYESRLRAAIGNSQAIGELATNPLLLTMMAILSRVQDLPRDRGRLYEKCAELLLRNWDLEKFPELKEKKEARDIKDKLGPDQKMRILEQVAAAMQQERTGLAGNLIGEDKLKEIVEKELERLGVPTAWSVADDLIWMLRERNFMLGHVGDRLYAFVHRTFLEYFCARDLKYRLEKTSTLTIEGLRGLFREHWRQEEWKECLRLLCGLIGPEFAGQCIAELLAQADAAAVVMAAQCLLEVRELGAVREVRALTRQKLMTAALVRGLDKPPQKSWFTIPFWNIGLFFIRYQAIRELARGWKDDPETFSWLKERAAQDELPEIRLAALYELARNWEGDADVLELLKHSALNESDSWVKQGAAQQLSRGWKDDPEAQHVAAAALKTIPSRATTK